ncbi:hypothetical protein YM304_38530 [Ilumatobacter coccineus YM16-304]|uniref:Uncharacterized protein n=2 Tax=Ilumatobacter coccineus TaxID=467094 RepID=A0A6C7EBQ0_ILUCY|nr:hypothetical protein YM304_38530 [Ilumatobacter coccineus YM16-304]
MSDNANHDQEHPMHTAPQPIIPTTIAPADTIRHAPPSTTGLRPVRLFAALGLLAVPAAGVAATTAIDPMAADTQLLLAGGFIAFGFGSIVALMTTHRPRGRLRAH